jgi:hypothetical protein
MVVEVAGIAITTNSITAAIDLALEASRRGLVARPNTPEASTAMPSPDAPKVERTPWEAFIAYLSRPEQVYQLRLLHLLRDHGGDIVSRDELCAALGLEGRGANRLGGIYSGVVKRLAKNGLKVTDVIGKGGDGYRAGLTILSSDLPEVPRKPS